MYIGEFDIQLYENGLYSLLYRLLRFNTQVL